MERRFYLVDAQVLPEVFLKVVRAKELLASGEARSISAATRSVDLSRSAFYKYKDCIFDSENGPEIWKKNIPWEAFWRQPMWGNPWYAITALPISGIHI